MVALNCSLKGVASHYISQYIPGLRGREMLNDPIVGPVPTSIPLPKAPLELVIGQVRFNTLLSVSDASLVSKLQSQISKLYPILEEEAVLGVDMLTGQQKVEKIWRFRDEQKHWRVSIHTNFLALEAFKYTDRDEFVERLSSFAKAFNSVFSPVVTQRIGIRYVDRLTGDAYNNIDKMLTAPFLSAYKSSLGKYTSHIVTEVGIKAPVGNITLKFGKVPAGLTIDPNAYLPSKEDSWVLDIDISDDESKLLNAAALEKTARSFSERIYAIFRSMITPEFITYYGGKNDPE